jgi:hypothetical protein
MAAKRTRKPREEPKPTQAQRDAICADVRQGLTPLQAALVAGVTDAEFNEWLRAGREGQEPAATLLQGLAKAEAECELVIVGRVKVAAKDDWKAAAWLAERRWPERYQRKSIQGDDAPRSDSQARAPEDPFTELDNVVDMRGRRGTTAR